ncbi:hypothetical protein SAMN05421835_13939 [Amycolatopsis sacchari]|uniref:Uncharacterized protein n=1 Tax=Amycolatopsis sacchari TaxID=115433 RepID=A0A1I4CZA0_9PSEU|nr:hypothetical protein SAMN05421835_13939 [Amycolatopsis sacchari]
MVPPYHVQSAGGFPSFAHHESVSALWSHKWRMDGGTGGLGKGQGRLPDRPHRTG